MNNMLSINEAEETIRSYSGAIFGEPGSDPYLRLFLLSFDGLSCDMIGAACKNKTLGSLFTLHL